MEKYDWRRTGRVGREGFRPPSEMFEHVTQITRCHQSAEVHSLLGYEAEADAYRDRAVKKGIHVLALAEFNPEKQHALEQSLAWLRGRDYDMYKTVTKTLEQAQVTIDMAKIRRNPRRSI